MPEKTSSVLEMGIYTLGVSRVKDRSHLHTLNSTYYMLTVLRALLMIRRSDFFLHARYEKA